MPPGVVTLISPLRAPAGTLVLIRASLTASSVDARPAKVTNVAPERFEPARVT